MSQRDFELTREQSESAVHFIEPNGQVDARGRGRLPFLADAALAFPAV
jgi:hypothetical protein